MLSLSLTLIGFLSCHNCFEILRQDSCMLFVVPFSQHLVSTVVHVEAIAS
jgi:hypothetical protein